ncbi:MAG: hypothetical protein HY330_06735 [Chloroflexi bacterium]|nr:hypothetical protein [Chloroflexota bacterium]
MEVRYKVLRAALQSKQIPRERAAESLAEGLSLDAKQVLEELDRPWGLKRLLSGKFRGHGDKRPSGEP